MITEHEFRTYLFCALTKEDLIQLVVLGAKNLQHLVAIGKPLNHKC
jgi:hypothetical protein